MPILLTISYLPPLREVVLAFGIILLVGVGLWKLAWGAQYRLHETTLFAPLCWAMLALVCTAAVTVLSLVLPELMAHGWSAPLRFMAAATTFCPLMAVLGAKRPQHNAWQWVVLTLWVITALPALESLALSRDGLLKISVVRGWFLWALIVLGLLVYLPTRCGWSALAVAIGQVLLLSPWLPLLRSEAAPRAEILAVAALVAAVWLVPRKFAKSSGANQLWLDFRDLFGALWAVRILERVNAAATVAGWPVMLTWTGFVDRETGAPVDPATLSPKVAEPLRQTLQNLVRRFADDAWINRRWPSE